MRDTNDLFLLAARKKFRFPSTKGDLTVEQLWDLPLTSVRSDDLDTVAKTINREFKATDEESFVVKTTNPNRGVLEAKLEIVKIIIATKQDEAREAKERNDKAERKRTIMEAIRTAEERELSTASKDELLKLLSELDKTAA
jgi:hypothetical protein